jgi:tetratricopeptide (TPR) repeat protein
MLAVNLRRKLFLSSTSLDLGLFRDVAIRVAARLGYDLEAMEQFGPDPTIPVDMCRQKVEAADAFVGLYAHRYGFKPDGFDGKSLTELEYNWAISAGLPVLIFLIDESLPWPPSYIDDGQDKARLKEFKAKLLRQHTVQRITSPDDFRASLFEFLPKVESLISKRSARTETTAKKFIPTRPTSYIAHTYTLLETKDLVGRSSELELLNDWIVNTDSSNSHVRVLCLIAIGGMGKTALAWNWFHQSRLGRQHAGRLWWSFYETESGYERFIASALAYVTGKDTTVLQSNLSVEDQEKQLLFILNEQPFLIVLDGLERLLVAYAGLDFAHLADEDLDRQTNNYPLDHADARTDQGPHRLRKTIEPRIGQFLRALSRVQNSKVLVTTRLFPSELQTNTGMVMPGTRAVVLRGLDPDDAVSLWRHLGVSGSREHLLALFETFEFYPLLIRAFAGEVARFRPAPGNFDAWRDVYKTFNPYKLPLVQVRSHILEFALANLTQDCRRLLNTIAAFRAPAQYATLERLYVATLGFLPSSPQPLEVSTIAGHMLGSHLFIHSKSDRWGVARLDTILTELEDRGLVGWDKLNNTYDIHPVVRGVVWNALTQIDQKSVYQTITSTLEPTKYKTTQLATYLLSDAAHDDLDISGALNVSSTLELFNALVGLSEYERAAQLYFARINHRIDFYSLGASALNIAMLESLLPEGIKKPPKGLDRDIITQLGHAYFEVTKFREALECYQTNLAEDIRRYHEGALTDAEGGRILNQIALGYKDIADVLMRVGALRYAEAAIQYSLNCAIGCDLADWVAAEFAKLEAVCGNHTAARHMASRVKSNRFVFREDCMAQVEVFCGKYDNYESIVGDDLIRAIGAIGKGEYKGACRVLQKKLTDARSNSLWEDEARARQLLASVHCFQSDLDGARLILDEVWDIVSRGPLRLIQADCYNTLATIELEAGRNREAVEAASLAFRHAYCDGGQFTYKLALDSAMRLLRRLGCSRPDSMNQAGWIDAFWSTIPTAPTKSPC